MALIEGVGDELTICLILTLVLLALIVAWKSTYVRDPPELEIHTQSDGLVSQNLDFPGSIEEDLERIANEIEEEAEAVENELSVLTLQRTAFLQSLTTGERPPGLNDNDDELDEDFVTEPQNGSESTAETTRDTEPIPTFEFPCPHEPSLAQDSSSLLSSDTTQSSNSLSAQSPETTLRHRNLPNAIRPAEEGHREELTPVSSTPVTCSVAPPVVSTPGATPIPITIDGHMTVRVKFLNDVIRETRVKTTDTIRDFKAQHFAEEMATRSRVRLIYNGQLLADHQCFGHYNITNNTVIHCLISRSSPGAAAGGRGEGAVDAGSHGGDGVNAAPENVIIQELDLSRLVFPLVAVILSCVWYFRVQYRQFFNATSSIALLFLTIVFFFFVFTSLRNRTHVNNLANINNLVNNDHRHMHHHHHQHQPPPVPVGSPVS